MIRKAIRTSRRAFLQSATGLLATAGTVLLSIPFVGSMVPSARAKARGSSVSIDVSSLEPGQKITAVWRGKPVWIMHRTKEMLEALNDGRLTANLVDPYSTRDDQQPKYAKNLQRSVNPNYLVVIGLCTHLGCIPNEKQRGELKQEKDWSGGFFCPCHGSKFDYAGRVYKNVPAPTNLVIPPYHFSTTNEIVIGSDGIV